MSSDKKHKKYFLNSDEIIGTVLFHHEFYSFNLKNERDIIVWLPPSYYNSVKRFPVIYINDGQNLFSPHTSFSGYDWKIDEVLTNLISSGLIEEVMVVGIFNTKDRLDEYNYFTESGKLYAKFILNELKIYIDETYRTKPDSNNSAIMGSSMGGLFSFQLIWNHPQFIGKAACMSNSFWVNDGRVFDEIKKSSDIPKNIKIYLDCGCEEKALIKDNKKMCSILNSLRNSNEIDVHCYFDKLGKHTEVDWAARVHKPFLFLFGK